MNYLQLRRSSRLALALLCASPALPSAAAADYTVRRGDTLSQIARHHRISLAVLQRANPQLKGGQIAQGQKLSLPAKGPNAAAKPLAAPPASSLGAAAKPRSPSTHPDPQKPLARPMAPHSERDTTIDLTPPARPTQAKEKKLPRPSGSPVTPLPAPDAYYHVVKSGETLSSIARSRGLSVAALSQANRAIDPKRLAPNQKLILPATQLAARSSPAPSAPNSPKIRLPSSPLPQSDASDAPPPAPEGATPPEDALPPETVSPGSEVAYLVAENDNLESIAREFRTTPSTLRQLNQLGTFDSPASGSVITVPWKNGGQLH